MEAIKNIKKKKKTEEQLFWLMEAMHIEVYGLI